MKAVKLSKSELIAVLKSFKDRRGQVIRLVSYLANKPKSPTVFVNSDCAIGNISDIARSANPTLYKHGLFISCEKPPEPLRNRFGEPSQMYLWSIFELQPAANDEAY